MRHQKQEYSFITEEERDYSDYNVERKLTKEQREKAFKNLLRNSHRIDQGDNGIILFTEKADLGFSEPESQELRDIPDDLASKLIKVYNKESVGEEFKLHYCAHEVLKDNRKESRDYAEIPIVHEYHDMEITEDIVDDLDRVKFPRKEVGDRLEVMIMDYIDGMDLGTYLYRNLAKEYQDELGSWVNNIDDLHFDALKAKLHDAMNLNSFEDVSDKLKAKDFSFPEGFLDKIKNTLRLLHNNNFYHRDLHERNIMLDENNEPYIIDFGNSIITEEDNPYDKNGKKKHIGDFLITNRHEQLAKSKKEEQSEKLKELRRRVDRIGEQRKDWTKKEINKKAAELRNLDNATPQDIKNYLKYKFETKPPTKEVEIYLIYQFLKSADKETRNNILSDYPDQNVENKVRELLVEH